MVYVPQVAFRTYALSVVGAPSCTGCGTVGDLGE
jgi:hypothetical protein